MKEGEREKKTHTQSGIVIQKQADKHTDKQTEKEREKRTEDRQKKRIDQEQPKKKNKPKNVETEKKWKKQNNPGSRMIIVWFHYLP